jgi:hypothetical protein
MNINGLVLAVKDHAEEHYHEGGWDYIVETCDDSDLIELIGGATTIAKAIQNVGKRAAMWAEYRQEFVSEIF